MRRQAIDAKFPLAIKASEEATIVSLTFEFDKARVRKRSSCETSCSSVPFSLAPDQIRVEAIALDLALEDLEPDQLRLPEIAIAKVDGA